MNAYLCQTPVPLLWYASMVFLLNIMIFTHPALPIAHLKPIMTPPLPPAPSIRPFVCPNATTSILPAAQHTILPTYIHTHIHTHTRTNKQKVRFALTALAR